MPDVLFHVDQSKSFVDQDVPPRNRWRAARRSARRGQPRARARAAGDGAGRRPGLAEWNRREAELIATDPDAVPPLALPPNPENAILGTLDGDDRERAAREGATLYLPTAIFDFDVRPSSAGPQRADRGRCAVTS